MCLALCKGNKAYPNGKGKDPESPKECSLRAVVAHELSNCLKATEGKEGLTKPLMEHRLLCCWA